MKEQENTNLLRKLYSAFSAGDIATIMDHLAPDVDWVFEGPPIIPYTGHRVGPAEVLKFFEALGSTQTDQVLKMDTFIAQGDQVAATGRFSAVVKATGKRHDSAIAHVFTIRDGKILKLQEFGNTAVTAEAFTP